MSPLGAPRRTLLLGGLGFAASVLGINALVAAGRPSLGIVDLGALTVALALALLGALSPLSRLGRAYVLLLLAGTSIAVVLFSAEILLETLIPKRTGRFTTFAPALADEALGYRLMPDWEGHFDDGIARGVVRTNALGHRDDPPGPPTLGVENVLLIGDSFTFGYLLDEPEVLDKRLEQHSDHTINAYNAGVSGYHPGNSLESLRHADWFAGSMVFYLFCLNDLRDDALRADGNTAFGGFVVPRYRPDGGRYSDAEYRRRIEASSQHRLRDHITDLLRLTRLRERMQILLNSEVRLLGPLPDWYHDANVNAVLEITLEMKSIASERQMSFAVVIVPSMGEAEAGRYSRYSRAYARDLRNAGVEVIEVIEQLDASDYFSHDGHFDASGADKTASAIWETILGARRAE